MLGLSRQQASFLVVHAAPQASVTKDKYYFNNASSLAQKAVRWYLWQRNCSLRLIKKLLRLRGELATSKHPVHPIALLTDRFLVRHGGGRAQGQCAGVHPGERDRGL